MKKMLKSKDTKLFIEAINELGFENVGEFVELVTSLNVLIHAEDYVTAQKLSEKFMPYCGFILNKMGLDKKILKEMEMYNKKPESQIIIPDFIKQKNKK